MSNTSKTPSPWQWSYAVALAVVVVLASSRSAVAAPPVVSFDKIAHFSVFGLMATLVLRPFKKRHLIWAAVIVSVFGLTDELHQGFTPGRSVEVADWVADTSGAIVAVCAYAFWPWYRRLLEKPLWVRGRPAGQSSAEKSSALLPPAGASANTETISR